MPRSEYHREMAAKCEQRARNVNSIGDRAQLLQIAATHLQSARDEEDRENGSQRKPALNNSKPGSRRS